MSYHDPVKCTRRVSDKPTTPALGESTQHLQLQPVKYWIVISCASLSDRGGHLPLLQLYTHSLVQTNELMTAHAVGLPCHLVWTG